MSLCAGELQTVLDTGHPRLQLNSPVLGPATKPWYLKNTTEYSNSVPTESGNSNFNNTNQAVGRVLLIFSFTI